MRKIKYFFLIAVFLFTASCVLAEEAVLEDENITASDLGIEEPTILPDSNLYFLKEWSRSIGNFFTFNPVKKAERQLRHANEKLIEAKKISEKTGSEEIATRAMEKYQTTIENAGTRIEAIKEKYQDDTRFQELVDKFTEDGFNHHRLISVVKNRMENATPEVRERIEMVRERVVSKVGEVLVDVDGEKLDQRINKITERIKGGDLKQFKNLEVLKELEEKLPEQALDGIRRAQENALKRIKENLDDLSDEEREEKLSEYFKRVQGNETRHLEILEQLKTSDETGRLDKVIDSVKEVSLERVEEKMRVFKTEEEKEKYLKHLEDGSVNKLKVLGEIENRVQSVDVKQMEMIRERAMQTIELKIQATEDPAHLERFKTSLEEAPSVKREIINRAPSVIKTLEEKRRSVLPNVTEPEKPTISQ